MSYQGSITVKNSSGCVTAETEQYFVSKAYTLSENSNVSNCISLTKANGIVSGRPWGPLTKSQLCLKTI
jgi:hypothetical protein